MNDLVLIKRKASALTVILVVLCSLAVLSCNITMANASFHIAQDGHVAGTDKIRRNGDVYTFTGNIDMDIRVEKSNIIIDGAGFKLVKGGCAGNWGIKFSFDVHDVTIKNLIITGFGCGISMTGSGNTVTGCTIIDCYTGILLEGANDNTITDNKFVNTSIRFDDSSNNRLRNNKLENAGIGTSWQNIYNDVDTSNTIDGKPVYYLVNQHDLVISPVNYPEIGCLILIGCTGITIKDIAFSIQTTNGGVTITYTSDSMVINNTFTDLWRGITIYDCSDMTVLGNFIVNNEIGIAIHGQSHAHNSRINITRNHIENNEMGISLMGSDLNIYHNNFINNTQHAYDTIWHPLNFVNAVTYVWDDGKQGNFWSDHNTTDADDDGVADTPYVINKRGNNTDRYPLMEPVQIEVNLPVEPEPTPSPAEPNYGAELLQLIAAASVASIAITTIALIIYFKKRKQ
ncbi:right-handed parallel beta-helix repeat-containing protein [Candidatus Bathyarchaeota archaeon]|nr:right-handed parallel beta-helix repeat-containing protein [Candidatus Bathyarchaeota archaeon]